MVQPRYAHNAGAAFSLRYRLVWCPEYRHKVLVDGMAERLKALLSESAVQKYVETQWERT